MGRRASYIYIKVPRYLLCTSLYYVLYYVTSKRKHSRSDRFPARKICTPFLQVSMTWGPFSGEEIFSEGIRKSHPLSMPGHEPPAGEVARRYL